MTTQTEPRITLDASGSPVCPHARAFIEHGPHRDSVWLDWQDVEVWDCAGFTRTPQLVRTLTAGAREHCAVAWLLDVHRHGLDTAQRRATRRAHLIAHLFGLDPEELT